MKSCIFEDGHDPVWAEMIGYNFTNDSHAVGTRRRSMVSSPLMMKKRLVLVWSEHKYTTKSLDSHLQQIEDLPPKPPRLLLSLRPMIIHRLTQPLRFAH